MSPETAPGPSLVIRRGALGDFILTLPVIRALTTLGPVYVGTRPRYAPLLPEGAIYQGGDWPFEGGPPPVPFLRAFAFSPLTFRALCETDIPVVRGADPRPAPGPHAVDHFGSVLLGLGPAEAAFDRRPRVAVAPDPTARGHVVIAPGSGGREKRWPLDRWRAVADALAAIGVPVLWVRGPDEHDEPGWPDALCPDLPALAALAAGCAAWLGPDAGPSHLAAAVREDPASVGVVFGPTDPTSWAPVGATVLPWDIAVPTLTAHVRRVLRNPDATAP